MIDKVSSIKMEWLLNPIERNSEFDLQPGVERVPFYLSPDVGHGWIDKIVVEEDVSVSRMVHDVQPSVDLYWVPQMNMALNFTSKSFHVGVWVRGAGMHHEYPDGRHGTASVIKSGTGQAVIFCGDCVDGMIFTAANCVSEYLSLTLPVNMLINMLGQEDAAEMLSILGVLEHKGSVVRDLPFKLMKPLEQAMSGPYRGVAQKLYCMARILDFLASLVHHCRNQNDQREQGNRRHRERVQALHEHLSNLDGKLPTLSSLAKQFGLSARRLNEAFAAEYGQSIFAYITDQRLQAAHEVIQATDEPMKLVAERLGYAHVNHFIAAFKRKYGYTPGRLRRGNSLA